MSPKTKYNQIGKDYNATRSADVFLTNKMFQFLDSTAEELNLDIGCGTGNYTIALAKKGLHFFGVEPSSEMLKIAQSKSNSVEWKIGTAEAIPAENETFHHALATLTIHHWENLAKAFTEINRVLKPYGTLVIFTSTPQQMENYWLNHYFPEMLKKSILQMPSLQTIEFEFAKTNFSIVETEKYFVTNELQDFFLYSGKDRPEIYVNEQFRKGISSFAALANKAEVERGVQQLTQDLQTNTFENIKNKFSENCGDYLFIVAEKSVKI